MARPRKDGGPAISATGPYGQLGWCDGHWAGDRELAREAEILVDSNYPLPSIVGCPDINFEDGELIYAASVMRRVIGSPLQWGTPPPEDAYDKLSGDIPEGAIV